MGCKDVRPRSRGVETRGSSNARVLVLAVAVVPAILCLFPHLLLNFRVCLLLVVIEHSGDLLVAVFHDRLHLTRLLAPPSAGSGKRLHLLLALFDDWLDLGLLIVGERELAVVKA